MRRIALVCCLALAGASPAFSEARSQAVWPRVYIENAHTATVVRRALGGAARRLTQARCQQVFSDFLDEQGRPLHARLQELEQTGPGYLPLVVFLDGSEMPQCRNAVMEARSLSPARAAASSTSARDASSAPGRRAPIKRRSC